MMSPTSDLAVAAAVNDDETLAQCLAASPDLDRFGLSIAEYRGFSSAALMINAALRETDAKWLVVAHQDVYLPAGFLEKALDELTRAIADNPRLGLFGVVGMTSSGDVVGETWSSGLGKKVGVRVEQPVEVVSLDEMLLIIRTDLGITADEHLPGYHLYGTDLALSIRELGYGTAVVPLQVIHHSRPVVALGSDYAAPYEFMRRKWKSQLPLRTLMGGVESNPLHRFRLDIRWRRAAGFKRRRPRAQGDPAQIARRIGYEAAR